MYEDGWQYKLRHAIDNANSIADLTLINNVLFGELQLVERKANKIKSEEKQKLDEKINRIIKEHQLERKNINTIH